MNEIPRHAQFANTSDECDCFQQLWRLGYRRVIPIVPPAVQVSPNSSFARSQGLKSDPRGKMPGVKGDDGKWKGLKGWLNHETTERDLKRWAGMGAGVGMRTGPIDPKRPNGGFIVAIDSDTFDEALALEVDKLVHAHFGKLPCRVGRYPKAAYPIRVSGPVHYQRVMFGPADSQTGLRKHAVEILASGKQFVCHGTHPATGQPYRWPRPLVPLDALTIVTPEAIAGFMAELAEKLPNATTAKLEASKIDRSTVDQSLLAGDLDLIAKAVAATPNTEAHFGARDEWIEMGIAIRAATIEDPGRGYEIWDEFSSRWPGYDPADTKARWDSFKGPFKIGAQYIYDLAVKLSDGAFTQAEVYFEPLGDDEAGPAPGTAVALFDEPASNSPAIKALPYSRRPLSAIPRREWLYGRHLIRKFVSATVAPGGVGKSSLAIVEALAMVSGRALLHDVKPPRPLNVWLWNGEDPMDELERRIEAACLRYDVDLTACEGRLFVNSGRDTPLVIAETTRAGLTICRPVVDAVIATAQENKLDVLSIDPFVSSHRVSENDNMAIDAVAREWADVANACNCAIGLSHHSRKTGGEEVTVEAARGASALISAARSARTLNPMNEDEALRVGVENRKLYFRVDDGKANLAPPGDRADWYRLESVDLMNGDGNGPGDKIGVVTAWEWPDAMDGVTEADVAAVQTAIAGSEWRADSQAEAWAGNAVAQALGIDIDDKAGRARVRAMIKAWLVSGHLVEVVRSDKSRHSRKFIEVGGRRAAAVETHSAGLFD